MYNSLVGFENGTYLMIGLKRISSVLMNIVG